VAGRIGVYGLQHWSLVGREHGADGHLSSSAGMFLACPGDDLRPFRLDGGSDDGMPVAFRGRRLANDSLAQRVLFGPIRIAYASTSNAVIT